MTTHPELIAFRASIDNLDSILIHTLAERFRVTQAVGKLKAEKNMPPADDERGRAQIDRLRHLAKQSGLDPEFAEKFLAFIVTEVIQHHKQHIEASVKDLNKAKLSDN